MEKRAKAGVRFPTFEKTFILVQRGDVGAGDLQVPVGPGADGVDDPLRDPLPVEAGQLLDEVVVLQQDGPGGSGGLGVLVVGDGGAGLGGQDGTLGHGVLLPGPGEVDPVPAGGTCRPRPDRSKTSIVSV